MTFFAVLGLGQSQYVPALVNARPVPNVRIPWELQSSDYTWVGEGLAGKNAAATAIWGISLKRRAETPNAALDLDRLQA
jgi:hypothetical protein